jgi:hypothetical protein
MKSATHTAMPAAAKRVRLLIAGRPAEHPEQGDERAPTAAWIIE